MKDQQLGKRIYNSHHEMTRHWMPGQFYLLFYLFSKEKACWGNLSDHWRGNKWKKKTTTKTLLLALSPVFPAVRSQDLRFFLNCRLKCKALPEQTLLWSMLNNPKESTAKSTTCESRSSWGWKGPLEVIWLPLLHWRRATYNGVLRTSSRWIFKMPQDDDSTASPGNLCQWLFTYAV